MPDKKVATQASDGPWERETIITFNDAEKKICGTGQTRQRTCRTAAAAKKRNEGINRLHMPEEENIKCTILTAH